MSISNAIQDAIEEESRLWKSVDDFYRPSAGQTWSHVAHRIARVVMVRLEEYGMLGDNDVLASVLKALMSIEDGTHLEEVDLLDRVGWRITVESDVLLDKKHADAVRKVLTTQETRSRVPR